ncbi:DUF3489 domain-containing protein [Sphingobium sp. ZW T5_29]|uniref:DUF3489 domain-containing protein n=1 Tax=Sphingobium sp. ZW T5_29 TaxID=3378077 RepID=UPI0038542400
MIKLTDMQLVLLTTAAARSNGSLLPPAESLGRYGDRIRRSVESLIKRAFAAEISVQDNSRSWREDAGQMFGVSITDAGRTAIGCGEYSEVAPKAAEDEKQRPRPSAPRDGSKAALLLGLLGREDGATLTELVQATGWLPHTTRAALTGLRKKGHAIAKGKRDEATCYRIQAAA